MKLTAAALSVVPLVLLWALARRLGASTAGAFLMVLIPTYTSRLSFAFLPSLFGHAVDMAFLLWIAGRIERVTERRTWLAGAAWVAACQLAYVSGVINISLLVAVLAAVTAVAGQRRAALAILAMGAAGSAVAVALYYRDFLPMVADVTSRIAGRRRGGPVALSRPVVLGGRLRSDARLLRRRLPGADRAGRGAPAAGTRAPSSATDARWPVRTRLVAAWLITYGLLLLGRARVPDLFLHGHETLLVTPLVCLASGEALAALARRGGVRRVAAAILLLFLAVQGLAWQWRALADQLAERPLTVLVNSRAMAGNPFAKFLTHFEKGHVLFREGEDGEDMYIIQSGKVAIKKKVKDGDTTLAVLEKGDFFGEMVILERAPRSATAEVVEPGDLIVINGETFGDMIRPTPRSRCA